MFGGSHEADGVVRRSSCRPGESMKSPGSRRAAGLRRRGDADVGPASSVSSLSRSSVTATGELGTGVPGRSAPAAPPGGWMARAPGRTTSRAAARGAAWAAVVLTSVTAVAGCSGESAPEPAPPETSPTASDSASSEPSTAAPSPSVEGPPEMPAAARGTSKKSAEAFVRYAVEVLNYGTLRVKPEAVRRISEGSCRTCTSIVTGLEEIRDADGEIRGGAWEIERLEVLRSPIEDGWTVQTEVRYGEQTVNEGRRGKTTVLPAGTSIFDFFVRNGDTNQRLVELRRP